jgi:hypothetical protein
MDFELEREYSSKDMNWCGLLCCINPLGCISRKYISPSRHQSMYTQRERERELLLLLKYEKSNLTHLKSFNILLHLFFPPWNAESHPPHSSFYSP